MIESISRIVRGRAIDAPAIFETPIVSPNFVQTLWMTAETINHPAGDIVRVTHIDSGEFMYFAPDEPMAWMQPEDKNSPSVQAEIITALAAKGIDL
jgi:hypothetical protein